MAEDRAPARRWLLRLPALLFAGLAVLFLVRLYAGDPAQIPSVLVGRPLPDFDLPRLEATADAPLSRLAKSDLRGRVSVVNFWGSWCAPCRDEHPFLMELAKNPSITLVGFANKDNPENARRFLGMWGNPFTIVAQDLNGRTAIDFGVYGLPETFIVSADGIIRYKQIGPLSAQNFPAFVKALESAGAP